jgi:TOMM system kinase/cyclase fusion protein
MGVEPDEVHHESQEPNVPGDQEVDPAVPQGESPSTDPSVIENTISFCEELVDEGEVSSPSSSKDEPADIPMSLGRFQIHGVLGKGGFGTVYLGFDDRLKRKVAIKVPKQVLTGLELDKFLEEARRLAQLRHPGIVTVFDVGEFDGRCYIVSDYLEGLSLAKWMKSKPYTWSDAALVTAQIAEALGHAHTHGTVHRDVKPGNVMMLPDNQPVVIDFGLAISDAHGDRELPGTISGTPGYMAPEQARGKGHRIDGRTDIYALGVMLYHMLCRKAPFQATSVVELFRQIREDDPQPPRQVVPDLPPELEIICLKAMSKKVGDRYTTGADLAVELRRAVQQYSESDASQPSPNSAPAPSVSQPHSVRSSEQRIHQSERRQITTLHVDLDDSAMDVDELDPEELLSILQRIRELVARIVSRYEGHFAQSTSDTIQAYFGYPHAIEDSARRAVLAGLDIRSDLLKLQERIESAGEWSIEFRIGIHTGTVVTEQQDSDVSSERHSIVGNVPRVAAGLAGLADPGDVVVSAATQQIVGDSCVFRSLGVHSGKGIGRNVGVFAVETQNDALSDSGDESTIHQAPLVGREHETGLLNERWKQVTSGSGQVVLLCAEAGVGKSRLLSAFRQALDDSQMQSFEARCSTYHQNSALHPIADLLNRLARISSEDSDESKLEKLEQLLRNLDMPLEPVIPLLVDLAAVPLGPRYAVFDGTPERRKQKTIEALVELMLLASDSRPLLLTIEDLHWIDPTTLQFLTELIEQVSAAPLLLVLTHRPSFAPPWPVRPGISQLTIGNLTDEQTGNVITAIAGGRTLPAEVVSHIVDKTGGVPLFAEELTKVILEADILQDAGDEYVLTRPLSEVSIPATLHDSLMARLDKLGSAKDIAQLASVIGREFPFPLLADVAPLATETLEEELTRLVDAELIHRRGFIPRARFSFKHALMQDAAYESLLRKTRQQWHGRIAEVLEQDFAEIRDTQPEVLAHHYAEAGVANQAIDYWLKAGQRSNERSANVEAIEHLSKGLALLATLDASPERDQRELQFQVALAIPLTATKGYVADEVERAYLRSREICEQMDDPKSVFPVLHGLYRFYVVQGDNQMAHQLGQEILSLAGKLNDSDQIMEAHRSLGLTLLFMGDFEQARVHTEQGWAMYDVQQHRHHAMVYGADPGMIFLTMGAWALWNLGYPDQARKQNEQALQLTEELKHPHSRAFGFTVITNVLYNCRDWEGCERLADEAISLAIEHGFPFWLGWGTIMKGAAQVQLGAVEAGLALIERGLQGYSKAGVGMGRPSHLAYQAIANSKLGRTDEGLKLLADALALAQDRHGDVFEAELHRLTGELLLTGGTVNHSQAEACFREALNVAARQNAKSLQLRAAMSLFELYRLQGKLDEARAELASVVDWFTEGFETGDLIAAKSLLNQL